MANQITINSLKQAISIKSQLQERRRSNYSTTSKGWTQRIIDFQSRTKENRVLGEFSHGEYLSPIEIIIRYPAPLNPVAVAILNPDCKDVLEMNEKSQFEIPAMPETVLAHLMRIAAIMPIRGIDKYTSEEGSRQTTMLLNDYLRRLVDHEVTEVDLVIGLEWFVENGMSDFFPSFGKLKAKIFGRDRDEEID